jgi:predicted nucleic acid-binding Zn ribbon protein
LRRGGYREPRSIREFLPAVFRRLHAPGGARLERLRRLWVEVAGPETASRTRLLSLEGGVLTVGVESSALKHDLATFRREELLRRLREGAPDVALRELRFRAGGAS